MSLSRPVSAALAILFTAALVLFGQAGLGSITGEVLDATGARLPHATLRLVETDTQAVSSTVTNDVGIFNFPSVAVGRYTLTITSAGFKEKRLSNLTLTAFQQLSLGQIGMEIGEGPSQTITVTAEQQLVKD